LKDFGGKLYGAVFQGELLDALQRSLSLTRARQVGLRLRLRLADTPELAEVPWEFLYDPQRARFLAQSRWTALVRYLAFPDAPRRPLGVEGPLRLLVMISSPSDYAELDAEHEWSLLTGALAQQQADGRVVIERLAGNMLALRQRLRQDEFHIVHFIGHGHRRPDWDSGVLVMADRKGRSHEVTGEELGDLLTEYDQIRLAVLNAREGDRSNASDPFADVAQRLIRQGLPAVVALQFGITDEAAIIFAREFYAAIADGYPLEAALAEARGALRDEGNLTEWGVPVLYSRAPDGHLFDLTGRGRISEQLQGRLRERVAVQDSDAVVAASGELAAVDPAAADPDELASTARQQITRRQQAERANVASTAHVMLVGDTQAGKTTMLLWLLGVTDSAVDQAAEVVRAGRGEWRQSATATPIQYCWSGDPDKWLLIQGKGHKDRTPRWVTADELIHWLAAYRSPSGEQVRWRVGDPPLEIGIPEGMADTANRAALRILDMPELHTASHQEDRVVRQLIDLAAPSTNVIVIVQSALRVADAMQDPAITGNPQLADWHSDTARFRIVLTRAFSAGSSRELLNAHAATTHGDPHEVAALLRGHVTVELVRSTGVTANQDELKKVVFPVDVGHSRQIMTSDPSLPAGARAANDLLLAELRETLKDSGSEGGQSPATRDSP
jgi:hypothetical protein